MARLAATRPAGVLAWLSALLLALALAPGTTRSLSTAPFAGANSYYLYTLPDSDQDKVLDALADANFKVLRIFITSVPKDQKGSGGSYINDVEPEMIGVYDDTILEAVDSLMYKAYQRDIQLIIALHDRYQLGWWGTDVYAVAAGIARAGARTPQVHDASRFYTNDTLATCFDDRIRHIMRHQNAFMDDYTWAQLSGSAIYAFEAENEPQGYSARTPSDWTCRRADVIASELALVDASSAAYVSSGGGVNLSDSTAAWATDCTAINFLAVHDYSYETAGLAKALSKKRKELATINPDQILVLEEWGASGRDKATKISQTTGNLTQNQESWMYWEVVMTDPPKLGSDFEVWRDDGDGSWAALTAHTDFSSTGWKSLAIRRSAHRRDRWGPVDPHGPR